MKFSHKTWGCYKLCPKRYNLEFIQKATPTSPKNDYYTLYGNTVQKFFELFCNYWRFESPHMFPEQILKKVQVIFEDMLQISSINWNGFGARYSKEEIIQQAYTNICTIMDSENQNMFLNTKAEVDIEITLKGGNVLMGRLDFIHTLPGSDEVIIFDGKGSTKIGANVDKDQLPLYALLYSLHYKKLPLELGFFYFRHNSFVRIPFDETILNRFRAELSLDIKEMTSIPTYQATPSTKACKYCLYAYDCQEMLERKISRAKPSKVTGIPEGGGVVEFGL